MVEITLGGSNAPICHGSGRRHQTMSDLVHLIEYVNANGNHRDIDDQEHLRAAADALDSWESPRIERSRCLP